MNALLQPNTASRNGLFSTFFSGGYADAASTTALPSYFNGPEWLLKRLVDFFATLIGLVIISPLLLLVAIAIKLESPGPVFFKQRRIGLNGQEFDMFKFRSMHQNAEQMLAQLLDKNETNAGMFKMKNDPRVTRVGRFIRKYSIDELPQLFNVLRGEMSLCGPRPPLLREVETYEPWHFGRFRTLPGLTGLWQVSGRSNIGDFSQVVQLDIDYINNWSLMLDAAILLKTVPVVLFGKDTA